MLHNYHLNSFLHDVCIGLVNIFIALFSIVWFKPFLYIIDIRNFSNKCFASIFSICGLFNCF